MWHKPVVLKLRRSGLFRAVTLTGAKVRASLSETLFLDVYYDPTSGSYSYALIDLASSFVGDKRILGWDDYPHENVERIKQLASFPHHFHLRDETGAWIFAESTMRGHVELEMDTVIKTLKRYLKAIRGRG